jgi:hypothetical protein
VLARRVMVCIDWMNVVCRILKHHWGAIRRT